MYFDYESHKTGRYNIEGKITLTLRWMDYCGALNRAQTSLKVEIEGRAALHRAVLRQEAQARADKISNSQYPGVWKVCEAGEPSRLLWQHGQTNSETPNYLWLPSEFIDEEGCVTTATWSERADGIYLDWAQVEYLFRLEADEDGKLIDLKNMSPQITNNSKGAPRKKRDALSRWLIKNYPDLDATLLTRDAILAEYNVFARAMGQPEVSLDTLRRSIEELNLKVQAK